MEDFVIVIIWNKKLFSEIYCEIYDLWQIHLVEIKCFCEREFQHATIDLTHVLFIQQEHGAKPKNKCNCCNCTNRDFH